MTKEEQIEEIATIISNYVDGGLHEAECDTLAMMISEAGYRKVSKNYIGTDEVLRSIGYRPTEEVRKETAKDILLDMIADILQLAQKYGVEVE